MMTHLNSLQTLKVDIALKAPFVSQASGVSKPGLDVLLLRDHHENIALPGTLIKGNLSHAIKRLLKDLEAAGLENRLDSNILEQLFGKASAEANYEPARGKLFFSPYWVAEQAPTQDAVQYRIRLDDTGTVKEGHFVVIESPWPANTVVNFKGNISFWGTTENAHQIANLIRHAFELIPALGAFKGVGFGQYAERVSVAVAPIIQKDRFTISPSNGTFQIALQFDEPFCFASRMQGNNTTFTSSEISSNTNDTETQKGATQNRFVSVDYVPGAALKGAMVNQLLNMTNCNALDEINLQQHGDLALVAKYIDDITINHALPVSSDTSGQPVYQALSIVKVDSPDTSTPRFCDMLSYLKSAYETGFFRADKEVLNVSYATDWKGEDFALYADHVQNDEHRKHTAIPEFIAERIVRIHTQIREGGNESDEHQLFSYECIQPSESQRWVSSIVLPKSLAENNDDAETESLINGLQRLLHQGICGLGKTDAFAKVSQNSQTLDAFKVQQYTLTNQLEPGQIVAIQLNSDAQLLPHIKELTAGPSKDNWNNETLLKAYSEQIHTLSGGTLKLQNFFAEQAMVGGDYYYKRFWKNSDPSTAYMPQLLTLKGSVFLCEVLTDDACTTLKNWVNHGIPALPSAAQNWWQNPYLNSLGFGQVYLYKPDTGNNNNMVWESMDVLQDYSEGGANL